MTPTQQFLEDAEREFDKRFPFQEWHHGSNEEKIKAVKSFFRQTILRRERELREAIPKHKKSQDYSAAVAGRHFGIGWNACRRHILTILGDNPLSR